jgi:hypothetical protein
LLVIHVLNNHLELFFQLGEFVGVEEELPKDSFQNFAVKIQSA